MTDKQLIKKTALFTKGMNMGIDRMCYAISAPLHGYLTFIGVECSLIECEVTTPTELWGHYCIELKDGRILDATAGQFKGLNLPNIYLGQLPTSYRKL